MTDTTDDSLLSEVEKAVRERFERGGGPQTARVPSTAREARETRVDQLVLPLEERGKMPFTKEKYLVKENPQRVRWERELRLFLRHLSPEHEHRIAAVHIYEWATGTKIADLMALEAKGQKGKASWRGDLRKLNTLLREYFGDPYMTWIMGRKVPKAYRVPKGWYVYRHRPKTLTLYAEWVDGVKL